MGLKHKIAQSIRYFTQKLPLMYGWRMHVSLALVMGTLVPAMWFLLAKPVIGAPPCPCNVFTGNPTVTTDTDPGGVNVGMKFRADIDGYITAVRFYKDVGMTGVHTGNIWDLSGNNLGMVTFTGETASGWQEMALATPVQVTAGTAYVVSLFHADGKYVFTANGLTNEIVNYPLRAPQNGGPYGGNGVANLSNTNTFPNTTFSPANYWVDVAFKSSLTATPPTVTSTVPTTGATNVAVGETVKATFDQHMTGSSLTTSTFTVKDSSNNPVSGVVSYNTATKTASFTATNGFSVGQTYTATIEGGTGPAATNIDNVALASDYTWQFTTTSTNPCPCSLYSLSNPAGAGTFDDTGTNEIGVKIKPSSNGYITAVRFYKPIVSTTTSRTVNIWSSTGTNLASATSSNETQYGWQEVKLTTPLAVTQGQLYIVSYATGADGVYIASPGGHTGVNITNGYLTAYADNSSENAATGSGNRNGVFGPMGAYPNTGSPNGSKYWVDAVFSTSPTVNDPLAVKNTQPDTNAIGIARDKPITARFNRALNSATVTNSTVRLFDSSNNQVAGTANYDSANHSISFTPGANLNYGQTYTMRLGASIADTNGSVLGSEYSWSFTVGSALSTDINQGPGGPILVITSTGNNYSKYYAEILRTEGLNYFELKDISTVTASTLAGFDAVLLAEMSLTQGQADMLSAWVNSGGNLIAMRPDKKLAGLLGLTDAGTTRANQYLQINTSSAPGAGITSSTMQFHGTADNYTLSGASSIATLFSDASTTTSNPAVVKKDAANGGQAAAFTFDLAKSVIAMHQGNQAWAGQERDGLAPVRPNDLFFGARAGDVQPDWVDLNKVHIPQADEQQRLLANMLTEFTRDRKPLPRFWYFPHDYKAAMVLAGDDHGLGNVDGTEHRLNDWLNESPTNCSQLDWQCVRASHYIYENSALTNSRALQYHNLGFEIGDHISTNCSNFTSFSQLDTTYTNDLNTWTGKYSSLPAQKTHRTHCYVWSDWDSITRVELNRGMRYNLNYVAYPQSWLNNRTPIVTGSGMNMRLTDASGNLLDVYQGVTDLDNTTSNAAVINNLLDGALGSNGYYGAFGTHYDMSGSTYHRTLFDAAKSKNVPMISSIQMLNWLDGRNSSNFSGLSGSNGQYSFTVNAAVGATGLRAMLPINDAGGTLTTLKFGDDPITYQTQTIKGVNYAVFTANPGPYTATYSDYNPNQGGGDNGNGDNPSENTGGNSSSSQVAGRGSAIGSGNSTTGDDTVAATDEQSPQTNQPDGDENQNATQPNNTQQEPNEDAPPTSDPFWPLIFGLLAFLILLGLGWWFILFRRRRKANDQDVPPQYFGN